MNANEFIKVILYQVKITICSKNLFHYQDPLKIIMLEIFY